MQEQKKDVMKVESGDLVAHMLESHTPGEVGMRQVHSNAASPLCFSRVEENWTVFQHIFTSLEEKKVALGLTQDCSKVLRNVQSVVFRIVMHALKTTLTSRKDADVEPSRKRFFAAVNDICEELAPVAEYKTLSAFELVKITHAVNAEVSLALLKMICNVVKPLGAVLSRMKAASQRRHRWFRKYLCQMLGGAIEPTEVPGRPSPSLVGATTSELVLGRNEEGVYTQPEGQGREDRKTEKTTMLQR